MTRSLIHALLIAATVGFVLLASHGTRPSHFIGCAAGAFLCFFASKGVLRDDKRS